MNWNLFEFYNNLNIDLYLKERVGTPNFKKCREYINNLKNIEDKNFISRIFGSLIYVNHDEFRKKLSESFLLFKDQIGENEFCIILDDNICVDHWCVGLLWNRIRQLNFRGFVTKFDDDIDCKNIVTFKDAIYSNDDLSLILDEYVFNSSNKPDKWTLNYHIVSPYSSESESINIFCNRNKINIYTYNVKIIPCLKEIFSDFKDDRLTEMMDRFEIPNSNISLLYFDHVIGDFQSTIPQILLYSKVPGKKLCKISNNSLLNSNPSNIILNIFKEEYYK
jgi:hypothetical protein